MALFYLKKIKNMKLILAVIIVINFEAAFAMSPTYIPWSENKLTWDDFLGIPGNYPPKYTEESNDLAFTWGTIKLLNYDFELVESSICQYQITKINAIGEFDQYSSWVNDTAKNDFDLLNHEQGKFDMLEAYARQAESKLLLKILPCPDRINDESLIHNDLRYRVSQFADKAIVTNQEYDNQIKNNQATQNYWNEKINLDLELYNLEKNDYSDESIPIFTSTINDKEIQCKIGWRIIEKTSSGNLFCVTIVFCEGI